ncbi:MobA-like NTP transferase domain-containing protein [Desulfonispora thiosulfatigenes DSM 11270]|uniref:MobA-like NTP transferase domain-containing protein n=1 Tax=Desulfonispora thiosulfatigenes DSM 11270 TaxID=656914 RepID=A0A1W1UZY7_DESTI|nr:nucleotidyltransferase family protein [Desulfonispora thiosulfatigenes]SMB86659.1 MobA-like NTP transferase domain-containing protein [Desulfonispora thiosulfatigenes DSM 11270]
MNWAIVLAGSLNEGKLQECSKEKYEALIKIGERTMISYVIAALQESKSIERIIVVGPEQIKNTYKENDITLVPPGKDILESILNGIKQLKSNRQRGLIITSDIPLIKGYMIDEFIEECKELKGDIFYPLICKELNDLYYPGVERTYVNLKDGIYTGGNIFMLNPSIIEKSLKPAQRLIEMRKSPLRLVKYIGIKYIFKYIFHSLTLIEIENRVEELLGTKGKAILDRHPEIGIDVDKPSDLKVVREKLT